MKARFVLILINFCFLSFFLKAQKSDSISVIIFLAETCPISQAQTLPLRELSSAFTDKGVKFTGVFPNENSSTEESIRQFGRKYKIPFDLKKDSGQVLTKQLSASITPQVFVLRNSTKEVLYSGRVDNGFEKIGKRRQVVTEHYLKNALENIIQNKPIMISKTIPVGCYIQNQ